MASLLEIEYDVAIIGGGPIGLSTAFELAVLRGQRVIVFEKRTVINQWGSSAGFSRQWRIPYAELWLAKLAVQASSAWNDLMAQTSNPGLLDRSGVYWFGDPGVTTPEGNIAQAKANMELLNQNFSYYPEDDEEAIKKQFPWISGGIDENNKIAALYVPDGGTIDIPATITVLTTQLFASKRAIIKENATVTKLDYSGAGVSITTSTGETFHAKKAVLTPGVYINEVLDVLSPQYPERLNLTIYLWSSAYFNLTITNPSQVAQQTTRLPRPTSDRWPVWIYFGNKQGNNINSFYGFPSDVRDSPFQARVCPGFTSANAWDFHDYPPPVETRKIDDEAVKYCEEWVQTWMKGWVDGTVADRLSTCVAGFATPLDPDVSDPGFVLDVLPGTDGKIVVCTGGWAMKFVPLFGRIIADLTLNGTAPDYEISEMAWNRGITKPADKVCTAGTIIHRSQEQRWLHFLRIHGCVRKHAC